MSSSPNIQLVLPGVSPGDGRAVAGWQIGDRVQLSPGSATGTIERLRGAVAQILWDTGARCPVPLAWIGPPSVRPSREAMTARKRRHSNPAWKRAHRPRTCRGCGGVFRPKRSDQAFCTASCRKRDHRNGSAPGTTKAVASRDARRRAAAATSRACAQCGARLVAMRSDAHYCSDACRRAAHRRRKRAGE